MQRLCPSTSNITGNSPTTRLPPPWIACTRELLATLSTGGGSRLSPGEGPPSFLHHKHPPTSPGRPHFDRGLVDFLIAQLFLSDFAWLDVAYRTQLALSRARISASRVRDLALVASAWNHAPGMILVVASKRTSSALFPPVTRAVFPLEPTPLNSKTCHSLIYVYQEVRGASSRRGNPPIAGVRHGFGCVLAEVCFSLWFSSLVNRSIASAATLILSSNSATSIQGATYPRSLSLSGVRGGHPRVVGAILLLHSPLFDGLSLVKPPTADLALVPSPKVIGPAS